MEAARNSEELQVGTGYRDILSFALPISFAILIPQLNFVTNNVFLGHFDRQSLAVAGITGVYYLIFAAIGYGLNNGLQALISRRAGENRPEEIGKLFFQGVLVSIVIAALGILLTYTLVPAVFGHFIHDPIHLEMAIKFLKVRIWGLPFLYVYQMRNALLVGTNQSRYLVFGTLAEALSNVLLDYLLIFGHWSFPALGFMGAAYASICAEAIGMITVFLVIHFKGIGKRFELFRHLKWDLPNLKAILNLSAPLIFQHAISIISWQYFFLMVEKHGEMDLAISNVMRNVFGIFGAVSWSFAATSSTMVSNVIGQGKHQEVWKLLGKLIRISTGTSIVAGILLNLFPRLFLSLFGQNEAFEMAAIPVIRVVSLAMVLMSVATIFLNAVTGTGNSKVTLLIEACVIVLYCFYVYFTLDVFFLPIYIGWLSEFVYWTGIIIPSYWYMKKAKWYLKQI